MADLVGTFLNGVGVATEIHALIETGKFSFLEEKNTDILDKLTKLEGVVQTGFEAQKSEAQTSQLLAQVSGAKRVVGELEQHSLEINKNGSGLDLDQQRDALKDAEDALIATMELVGSWKAEVGLDKGEIFAVITAVNYVSLVYIQSVQAFDNGEFGRNAISERLEEVSSFLLATEADLRTAFSVDIDVTLNRDGDKLERLYFDASTPESFGATSTGPVYSADDLIHRALGLVVGAADYTAGTNVVDVHFDPENARRSFDFDPSLAGAFTSSDATLKSIARYLEAHRPSETQVYGPQPEYQNNSFHWWNRFAHGSATKYVPILKREIDWIEDYVERVATEQAMLLYGAYQVSRQAEAFGKSIFDLTRGVLDAGGGDVQGTDYIDYLVGNGGNDTIDGLDGNDNLYGGAGNDSIIGGGGVDLIDGGTGDDTLRGGTGHDIINGGADDDRIFGYHGNDRLSGGDHADAIFGGDGNDTILGGDGRDRLFGGRGNDSIEGGAGDDFIEVEDRLVFRSNLDGHRPGGIGKGGLGNDTLRGGGTRDTLEGDEGDDLLEGGSGNDQLEGGDDNDSLFGEGGFDLIEGGYGDDFIAVDFHTSQNSNRTGWTGEGGIGEGGIGEGGHGNDTLEGGHSQDTLKGDAENDLLSGFGGNDLLEGGSGDDTLEGGAGDDTIVGGAGANDLVVYGHDRINYQVTVNAAGAYTITHQGTFTNEGTDTVSGVEQIQFNDGTVPISDVVSNAPIAVDDTNAHDPVISNLDHYVRGGNLLANDTDADLAIGDSLQINGIRIGTEDAGGVINLFGSDAVPFYFANGVQLSGTFGTLQLLGDGSYAYNLSGEADITGIQTDVFTYQVTDQTGLTDTAELVISVSRGNTAAFGEVSITGTPDSGETLTAVPDLGDVDGLGPLTYQWQYRDASNVMHDISGATSDTYTLEQADVGQRIQVVVSFVDGDGTTESVVSEPTAGVAHVNRAPTGELTIIGTPAEGQVLTINSTLEDADGLGVFDYQWMWDTGPYDYIPDAHESVYTDAYTLGQADVGKVISVRVFYGDQLGGIEQVLSTATSVVTNVNDAPVGDVQIVSYTLAGEEGAAYAPIEHETLTAVSTLADEDGRGPQSYQWMRGVGDNREEIAGATDATYTLSRVDVGTAISVRVSYTDGFGMEEAVLSRTTDQVINVNNTPTGTITIADLSPDDDVLTAVSTLADEDGIGTFSYQWLRDTVEITGATSASYTLQPDDEGVDVSVVVSYTDDYGAAESVYSSSGRALAGTPGVDRLEGGIGSDTITGGDGDDVYYFETGFGVDLIKDTSGFDIIEFGEGITRDDVRLWTENYAFPDTFDFQEYVGGQEKVGFISIGDNKIFVHSQFGIPFGGEAFEGIEEIHFADGTIIDMTEAQLFQGSDGPDNTGVPRDGLADTVEGGLGDDSIEGGDGDTTYIMNPGFGREPIFDFGGNDVFAFGPGFDPSDLRITFTFGYLLDLFLGTDATTIFDPFIDPNFGVETARFSDGTEIDLTGDLEMRGTDENDEFSARLNDTLYGEAGNDLLGGGAGAARLFGGVGDDILNGGLGNDHLSGGADSDIAVFNDASGNIAVVAATDGVQVTSADGVDFVASDVEHFQFSDTTLTFAQVTALAQNTNVAPTGTVTITGTPAEDAVLTAVSTLDDADGLGTLAYQWLRDGDAVDGANTATYTLGRVDIESTMSVHVSYTDQGGAPEEKTSAATPVIESVNHNPIGAVTITGTPAEDAVLTAVSTLDDVDGLGVLYYQWLRDGEILNSEVAETYSLVQADVGAKILARVTYTDTRGTQEIVSSAQTLEVTNVNDAPDAEVSIVGTPVEGAVLRVVPYIEDEDGVGALSYQWLRGTEEISGETDVTYILDQDDVDAMITARVTYTDQQGAREIVRSNTVEGIARNPGLVGTEENDLLVGGTENDRITGLTGRDTLIGSEGHDTLIGNKGSDELNGNAGNDVLFGDAYRVGAFSPEQANLVFRLYQATLNRAPDMEGHLAWTDRLVDGVMNLSEISRRFVESTEFQETYGALEDSDFVTLLYNNILGRDPDEAGRLRWEGDLANLMPRGDVVLGLSESEEFKITTNAAASTFGDSGSWSDEVYRLYGATLDRTPNAEGFHNWSERLASGVDFKTVVTGFVESEEFQTKYGDLDNTAFITQLYRNVLGREPEEEGLANSVQRLLDGTTTRVEAVLGFSESAENKILTDDAMKGWIRDLEVDDILNGGPGENTFVGGIGADSFVFDQSDTGINTVLDLEAWDYLEFRGFAYDVPAKALNFMQQTDVNVVFADQGVHVTFVGVNLTTIAEDMFL